MATALASPRPLSEPTGMCPRCYRETRLVDGLPVPHPQCAAPPAPVHAHAHGAFHPEGPLWLP